MNNAQFKALQVSLNLQWQEGSLSLRDYERRLYYLHTSYSTLNGYVPCQCFACHEASKGIA